MKTLNIMMVIAIILILSQLGICYTKTDLSITSGKASYKQGESAIFKIVFTVDSDEEGGYCKIDDINLTFSDGKTTFCKLQASGSIPSVISACGFTVRAEETGCGAYGYGGNGNQINYTITGEIPYTWNPDRYTARVDVFSVDKTYTDSVTFDVTLFPTTTTVPRAGGGGGGGPPRAGGIGFQPGETCFDGIQNQGEEGIDCGGPCKPCPSCFDGIQNQGEEGVDCGGPCKPCTTLTTITTTSTTTTTTTIKKTTTTLMKETTTTTIRTEIEETKTTLAPPSPSTIPLVMRLTAIALIGIVLLFIIYRTMSK